jgi:hypothetical protein
VADGEAEVLVQAIDGEPRRGARKMARHAGDKVVSVGAAAAVVRVTEPPNYDGPHVPVIVIMTSDSHTYVPHNLKDLLSSEQDPIIGVL